MKKSISPFLSVIIAIVTLIVLVFNPVSRIFYDTLGWNTFTQIVFFIAIMLLLGFFTLLLEQKRKEQDKQ